MTEEEKREQTILNIAEAMRRENFTFEFKVKEKPVGIKIIYQVTQEDMNAIMKEMMKNVQPSGIHINLSRLLHI